MQVVEIGIISNGLPVFVKTLDNANYMANQKSHLIKSAFLSAIQSNFLHLYNDRPTEMIFKKFRLILKYIDEKSENLLYVVLDKKNKRINFIKHQMEDLSKKLGELFLNNKIDSFNVKNNPQYIEPLINERFPTRPFRYTQRFKNVFLY